MYYLIEPYNAYQKPAKKRHWTEDAADEALYFRLVEAQRQQQESQKVNNRQNVALPQHAPQPPSQQVQDGQYAAPAGGGGWVMPAAAEDAEVASFGANPSTGPGPLTVTFTNYTRTPENDTFYWSFGSGSLTSTLATPPPVTYRNIGSYTVVLQAISATGVATSTSTIITVGLPTLTAALVANQTTGNAPLPVTFSSANTIYNGSGTLTYFWQFGSGSLTSTLATPSMSYATPGVYTVSLQVTESSFNVANKGTRTNYISASVP